MKSIEFEHIGKQYRLGRVGTGSLQQDLNRFWQTKVMRREDPYLRVGECNDTTHKGESDYVWALKDISFGVEQGEIVGVIGRNGAGKSTLLKLLSNITAPTTGRITYQGRVASLLEVGTGFHPELTGRENIFMNGAILGMTHTEIASKLDAIVDFAGVERYLDTPVKRYSSGMTVRLGFAVAAFLEPDILVVDEVLAVGDAEFQKKAIGKMHDVSHEGGRTVLFVSHNMASIKKLCNRGLVLENGTYKFSGAIKDAVEMYIGDSANITQNAFFNDLSTAPGNDNIRIKSFEVLPMQGNVLNVESGIRFRMAFMCYRSNIMMDATFELHTIEDIIVFHRGKVMTPEKDSKVGVYTIEFSIPPFTLNTGKYVMKVFFGENQRYVLWGNYYHTFEIENTLTGQGYNMSTLPGILKPNFDFLYTYAEE